jgi:hypothetical protein
VAGLQLSTYRVGLAAQTAILRRCLHCGRELEARRRRFCSDSHRARAYRRRRVGLPENLYPEGGSRGRLGLDDLTAAQTRLRLLELRQS